MAFSATEASLAGFRLVRRRPWSIFIWTVLWVVFAYGPLAALLAARWPEFAQQLDGLQSPERDPKALLEQVMRLELSVFTLLGPWLLWIWVLGTIVYAAVYRAVLEPKNRGFAYLRVGGDEVRLFLLQIIFIVFWVAFASIMTGAGVGVFVAARALQSPWEGVADGLGVIVLVCLGLYVTLRLALAAPMTFAEKQLRIFDSWGLTRGQTLNVLAMLLLVFAFVMAIAMIAGMFRNAVMYGVLGRTMPTMAMSGHFNLRTLVPADLLAAAGPVLVGFVIVQGLIDTLLRVIAAAPLAAAYRDLSASETHP